MMTHHETFGLGTTASAMIANGKNRNATNRYGLICSIAALATTNWVPQMPMPNAAATA